MNRLEAIWEQQGNDAVLMLRHPGHAQEKTVYFYIFGLGGVPPEDELQNWQRAVADRHIGNVDAPAFLNYLGADRPPYPLGSEAIALRARQLQGLEEFVKTLPQTAGEYGSWWETTRKRIEDQWFCYVGYNLRVYLFMRQIEAPPYEWDESILIHWQQRISNSGGNNSGLRFRLIGSSATPFCTSAVSDAMTVKELIEELFLESASGLIKNEQHRVTLRFRISADVTDWGPLLLEDTAVDSGWQISSRPNERIIRHFQFALTNEFDSMRIAVLPEAGIRTTSLPRPLVTLEPVSV